jgi:hypothetical protein
LPVGGAEKIDERSQFARYPRTAGVIHMKGLKRRCVAFQNLNQAAVVYVREGEMPEYVGQSATTACCSMFRLPRGPFESGFFLRPFRAIAAQGRVIHLIA